MVWPTPGPQVVAVACGFGHTLLLSAAPNRVWACGYGGDGALGLGSTTNMLRPEPVTALDDKTIVQVPAMCP
eukprot:7300546-Pyramimonas_sp.AAC.1